MFSGQQQQFRAGSKEEKIKKFNKDEIGMSQINGSNTVQVGIIWAGLLKL